MERIKKISKNLDKVISWLEKGKVVICATDTVYGFLADFQNRKAIEKIYKIKKRPKLKPLPVFVKNLRMAKELAEISKTQEKIIRKHWPGKYTFVLNKKNGRGTIALRVPKYKFLLLLLKRINRPLSQTSVNISGQSELIKSSDIIKQFQNYKDLLFVDAGNLPKRKPSAIIDLTYNEFKFLRK